MSDWLSPILVKELRQGMRSRVFEMAFILIQLLMVLAVLVAVMAAASERGGETAAMAEFLFWAMIAIPVLFIMPLRGTATLRPEIDGRTLELIFLTRLSAWRIVLGKWAALFGQTLLLVVACLPYVVMRYYLGGVNIVRDLLTVSIMLCASALLSAVTVASSAYASKLARGMSFLVPLALLYFGPIFFGILIASRMHISPTGGASASPWRIALAVLFYISIALLYALETGAARIAPRAENHAIPKRTLGLLLLLSAPVGLLLGAGRELVLVVPFLLVPILVDALCGHWEPLPAHRRPIDRLGRWGRPIAPFFLPGWPSGFLYTLVVSVICVVLLASTGWLDETEVVVATVAAFGALVAPLAVALLIQPSGRHLGTIYIGLQLITIIVTVIFLFIEELFDLEVLKLLSVSPLSTFMMRMGDKSDVTWLPGTALVTVAAVAVIVILLTRIREGHLLSGRLAPTAEPADAAP